MRARQPPRSSTPSRVGYGPFRAPQAKRELGYFKQKPTPARKRKARAERNAFFKTRAAAGIGRRPEQPEGLAGGD